MAHDVFISYSNRDKPIADGICANLEAAGVRCWIAPRDIAPGEDWPASITKAISQSRVMVLVFSAHSNSSEDVSRELFLAANSKLVIIPFKIENIEPEPGKQYYLARTHWLDAINPPTQEQIHALIDCVKTIIPVREPEPNVVFQPVIPPASHPRNSQFNPAHEMPIPESAPMKKIIGGRRLRIAGVLLAVLCLAGLFALGVRNHIIPIPAALNAPGSTSTPTARIEPTATKALETATATIPATPTPTPTQIPTSSLSGEVKNVTKLYVGPGEYYMPIAGVDMVMGNVTILAQAFNCDWLEVSSANTGNSGWLSANKVTFNVTCQAIPAVQLTKSGCSLTSIITISNSTGAEANLLLAGAENFTFYLQPNSNSVRVCAGTYTYTIQTINPNCALCYDRTYRGSVASGQAIYIK